MQRNIWKIALFGLFWSALVLTGCATKTFQAQRVDAETADKSALEITDTWVMKDTEIAVADIIKQMNNHPGFIEWKGSHSHRPKLFVAEVQNETAEAYFPIDDINDELLNQFSMSGQFTLIDAAQRKKILAEISYQNDGMVDPSQAKSIGKQSGADMMIFGAARMKPESREGKTYKAYTLNLRLTDIETTEEVCRMRAKSYKISTQAKTKW
jgi:uncharacterized protein (TIGR02722 family)